MLATLSICTGIGASISPVIGGILYYYFGYVAPFIFSATIAVIPCFMVKKFVPEIADESSRDQTNDG